MTHYSRCEVSPSVTLEIFVRSYVKKKLFTSIHVTRLAAYFSTTNAGTLCFVPLLLVSDVCEQSGEADANITSVPA